MVVVSALLLAVCLTQRAAARESVEELVGSWTQQKGFNCYTGHGAVAIDVSPVGILSVQACKEKCDELADCTAITFATGSLTGSCWRRKAIDLSKCDKGTPYDTWTKGDLPPSPTPTPPPAPAPPSSFIAVGDWGYNAWCHGNIKNGCQDLIANAMKDFMQEQGSNFKFVVNVGDSFYCDGVSSSGDARWQTFWRNHYFDAQGARDLTRVPWYSVYGNHDMGQKDPCPCLSDNQCHQVNSGIENWILPSLTYHVTLEDLKVEIVAMDFNSDWTGQICGLVSCKASCSATLDRRAQEAKDYFFDRYEKSSAKTLIAFSHYPTDYLAGPQDSLLNKMKDNSKHNVVYFGGHRHNVDQQANSIGPNVQWLTGGGGGYSCDGASQGFVKGFIHPDGTVTTEAALVSTSACCGNVVHENGVPAPGAGSIESIHCIGGNCTTSIVLQGVCVRARRSHGLLRLWCEAEEHVKIDEMDADCEKQLAWHFVPQDRPVAVRSVSRHFVETVEYRCGRSTSIPHGWMSPEDVAAPDPTATMRSIRWDNSNGGEFEITV